jgi:hypothetical protein
MTAKGEHMSIKYCVLQVLLALGQLIAIGLLCYQMHNEHKLMLEYGYASYTDGVYMIKEPNHE